ncbi:MAG: NUDIX hydrolase [Cyanosarcina radialis HA8281-LM2]|jgi:8-oxo-dGTP diphosphatase|nr:NUDIX hydrolase [Cyanosarcina radialis HA8281-LM2]
MNNEHSTLSFMPYTYEFPRPSITVDCVVFGLDREHKLKILLIQRNLEPFKGEWALPGGFVRIDETLEAAALRELREETGIETVFLEQLYTFGKLDRDPRERVITVAYYALVNLWEYQIRAATDASDAAWFTVDALPSLAFDHDRIVQTALKRLQGKLRYEPIGFELLPEKFTLFQLQKLYETVLGQELDKRNFRKKILNMNLLIALDEFQQDVSHRAARLYQFDRLQYEQLKEKGFNFEI